MCFGTHWQPICCDKDALDEIGELLRHRSPNTTAIYAKVDLVALRSLALPWLGGGQ